MDDMNNFNEMNEMNEMSGPVAPAPAKPRRKGKKVLKGVALVLAAAIVAGAAGFGGAALYRVAFPVATPEAQVPDRSGAPGEAGTTDETDKPDKTDETEDRDDESGRHTLLTSGAPLSAAGAAVSPEELYEAVLPSCVGITVSTTVNIWGQTTTSAASGSGFILTADGYIATNYHVIEDARSGADIAVTLSDGTRYTAKLVGGDEGHDVAVVKIDAEGLTPAVIGDSGSLRVAQWVCTVGNPLGELTFSFSDGRVSALDRIISTDNSESMNMLQTNCAINPGNSGGPLFDEQGRVVGIVTAKYTRASTDVSAEGLGFAIPIDDVKSILTDLMDHGGFAGKPLLGVTASTVTETMQRYGLPAGAAVESVNEGSCAEKAGLQEGDIITALDGKAVASHTELAAAIAAHRAGDTVTLTVYRQGRTLTLTATLDEQTDAAETPQQQTPEVQIPSNWPFGYGNWA